MLCINEFIILLINNSISYPQELHLLFNEENSFINVRNSAVMLRIADD
jgi:hypothetical protein